MGFMDILTGGVHIAEDVLHHASAGSVAKGIGEELGPVGAILSGGQALLGLERAHMASSEQNGSNSAETNAALQREEDRGFGDAIWHGLGAVGSFIPGVGLGMGVADIASEAMFGQSPGAAVANLINGAPLGQHLAYSANVASDNEEHNEGFLGGKQFGTPRAVPLGGTPPTPPRPWVCRPDPTGQSGGICY
jgi:hypothetical protein